MKASINIFRWILRVLSVIFIVFFLFMFIGETFFQDDSFSPKPMSTNSIIQILLIMIGLAGLALAWKWELTGGIIALAAYIVLAIVNPVVLQPTLLLIYPVVAILFIVLWAISRKMDSHNLK